LLRHFEPGTFAITATEVKHLIEKQKYPLKMNIYQLTKELKRIFGNPIHAYDNGKQGRYYYLTSNLMHPLSGFVDEYAMISQVDGVPF